VRAGLGFSSVVIPSHTSFPVFKEKNNSSKIWIVISRKVVVPWLPKNLQNDGLNLFSESKWSPFCQALTKKGIKPGGSEGGALCVLA
jgi:hypothetical protein